jgi:glutaredoxin
MKKILIVVVLLIAGYFLWQKFFHDNTDKIIETSYEKPYVVVYGRDACGWTIKYLNDLRNEGIDAIYKIVDNDEVSDELHLRMKKAGLDTTSYYLPVIDANGQIFIRPELNKVLEAYKDYK